MFISCSLCARPRAELRHQALPAGGDQQEIREELEYGCQAGWGVHQVGGQQPAGRKEESPSGPGFGPASAGRTGHEGAPLVHSPPQCPQHRGRPAGPGKQARKYYVDHSDPSFTEP